MLRHVVVGCKRLSQHFVQGTDYLTNVDFDAEVHKDVTADLETVNICCPCGVKHVFTIDAQAEEYKKIKFALRVRRHFSSAY